MSSTGIQKSTAIAISALLSLTYVLVIYINKPSKASLENGMIDRNDPVVVKDRVKKIVLLTLLTVALFPTVLSYLANVPVAQILYQYGLLLGWKYSDGSLHFHFNELLIAIRDIFNSLLLVVMLFAGPLIDYLFFSNDYIVSDLLEQLSTLQGQRDLVIGPLTEEIIYTASIIVTLQQADSINTSTLIFLPPVFFSFAHFHHAYQLYKQGRIALRYILLATAFQLFYTFLFGIFTNYLFLRTRNVWACFIVHFFCNFMGFPKFIGFQNMIWKYIYFIILILSVVWFKSNLAPYTESPLSIFTV